jgi:hypothetical protein
MQRDAIAFGIDNYGAITVRSDLLFLFQHFSAAGARFLTTSSRRPSTER